MKYMVHDKETSEIYEAHLEHLLADITSTHNWSIVFAEKVLNLTDSENPLRVDKANRYEAWKED